MPLILPARTLDSSYEISNSIRFDGTANFSDYTFGTSSNLKKRTLNFWVKRSKIDDSGGQVVIAYDSSGAGGSLLFQGAGSGVGSNDQLFISNRNATSGSSDYGVRTNRLFRDVSAWYNIHILYDTTQSTSSNRIKIYVNGVQETDLAQTDYPNQGYDSSAFLGSTTASHEIGRGAPTGSMNYFKGYFSNFAFVDGEAYEPSYFGEFNNNNVWIPKDPLKQSITWGNVGFFLEFKQSGSNQNASGQGADTSGNDNHLNPNNMGTTDTTTDTPTNNFATFNPLDNNTVTGGASFREGNLVIDGNSTGSSGAPTNFAVSNGKWYVEGKCLGSTFEFGVFGYGKGSGFNIASNHLGNAYTIDYDYSGNIKNDRSTAQSSLATYTTNDILAIALDMDNNTIKFFKSGSQVGTTLTEANLGTKGPFAFYIATHTSGNTDMFSLNTGNPAYTISSGNADGNGYGNFEYAPPSGYFALCTKNLAEYG